MPTYEITSPDGRKFRVTGPGSKDEALAQVQKQAQPAALPPQGNPDSLPTLAELDTMRSRPNTPEPSFMQRTGSYLKDYGRNIAGAISGMRPGEDIAGGLEAMGSLATGAVAPFSAAAANLVGNRDVSPEEFTYQPRTQTGRAVMDLLGAVAKPITDTGADVALAPLGMEAGAISSMPKRAPQLTREQILSKQSVGAASASSSASVAAASPRLQDAVVRLERKSPGSVNPEVLARHADADTLPVPVQLTKGQATKDPSTFSTEINSRGGDKALTAHYNAQEAKLGENLQAIRDQAGPEVFTTNATEHGDTLVAAYKAKDAAAEAAISAKYQALRDANGGQFPVDAKALLSNATERLHRELLFDDAPPTIMRNLERLSNKGMTFENFESMRTNLARIQRSLTADGNTKTAAGIIRQAMEDLPLSADAAHLKPLADSARAAAKARFDALRADPAYKAVADDKIAPDNFVRRFVINAPRDQVAMMRKNLADNISASQTISTATVDHLRQAAGLDNLGNGKFNQARFNKALESLSPKMRDLVSAQIAEDLAKVGRVGRYIQERPAGGFVNESNTFTALAGEIAKNTGEHAVNIAAHGVPVGTVGRGILARRKLRKETLAPGAGLNYLSSERRKNSLAN